ncbi:MAG: hypothetical protein IJY47_04800 [Clostridia bacterium]|nr:hypothetical protein [Clostridia bacterium]
MAESKLTRESCLALLNERYARLRAEGVERYPQRSDFSDREVVAIKAFLGPWPRALESAGIKPPRDDGRAERNLEKRIRAKRRRTEARKASVRATREKSQNAEPNS